MSMEEDILHGLSQFGKVIMKGALIIDGTIKSVDEQSFTCSVGVTTAINGSDVTNTFMDVPLRVLKNKQASFIEIPKIGSACLMTFRDNNTQRPQIAEIHECDKVLMAIDKMTMALSADGFVFNGGENDGLVLVNKLVEKINKIEDAMNKLIKIYNTHVHVCAAPASPSAVPTQQDTDSLTKTSKDDIENTKIKQ